MEKLEGRKANWLWNLELTRKVKEAAQTKLNNAVKENEHMVQQHDMTIARSWMMRREHELTRNLLRRNQGCKGTKLQLPSFNSHTRLRHVSELNSEIATLKEIWK
jgi:hypothetical protein